MTRTKLKEPEVGKKDRNRIKMNIRKEIFYSLHA